MKQTVAQAIHAAIGAKNNCEYQGNKEWAERWRAYLLRIEKDVLPSGSGIDNGTRIALSECAKDRITLRVEFHHMTAEGFYDGWTQHKITVRPAFTGLDIRISGRNKNGIKDYLHEVYSVALSAPMSDTFNP